MKKYRYPFNILLMTFLILTAVFLVPGSVVFNEGVLEIRHYLGLFFVFSTFVSLFINRNVFTLLMGLTLFIGNFAGLSTFINITTSFLNVHVGPLPIPLYWGQPEYSLLLVMYLLFNKDFYTGMLTREYWSHFLTRREDLEAVYITIDKTSKLPDNTIPEEDKA